MRFQKETSIKMKKKTKIIISTIIKNKENMVKNLLTNLNFNKRQTINQKKVLNFLYLEYV
jgi:ribosomal protein L11 methylase PrmA